MDRRTFAAEQIINKLHEAGVPNREAFTTLLEAQVLLESWRKDYNHIRPHRSLGYRPPAPVAIQPARAGAGLTFQVVQ